MQTYHGVALVHYLDDNGKIETEHTWTSPNIFGRNADEAEPKIKQYWNTFLNDMKVYGNKFQVVTPMHVEDVTHKYYKKR
jgi:hypothetical protein